MAATQLRRLSIRHEEILAWIIANPTRTLGECAAFFNVTQSWLSIVVNSDIFQAMRRKHMGVLMSDTVLDTRERIMGLTNLTLRKLEDKVLADDLDGSELINLGDKMLGRLGYGGSATQAPTTTNVMLNVVPIEELERIVAEQGKFTQPAPRSWTRPPVTIDAPPASDGHGGPTSAEPNGDAGAYDDRVFDAPCGYRPEVGASLPPDSGPPIAPDDPDGLLPDWHFPDEPPAQDGRVGSESPTLTGVQPASYDVWRDE